MKQLSVVFWGRMDGKELRVGFTSKGIASLGAIWQFIPRAQVGDKISFNQAIASIESTTALRSLLIPVNGILSWINPMVLETPEAISETTDIFGFVKTDALSSL